MVPISQVFEDLSSTSELKETLLVDHQEIPGGLVCTAGSVAFQQTPNGKTLFPHHHQKIRKLDKIESKQDSASAQS